MKFLSMLMLMALPAFVNAQPVVAVVNTSNTSTLSPDDVRNIFLGKLRKFPNGGTAIPIEVAGDDSSLNADFDKKVLKKDPAQVRAYWAQMVFTGRATPPKQVGSTEELLNLVEKNPNVIGYTYAEGNNAGKVKAVPLN